MKNGPAEMRSVLLEDGSISSFKPGQLVMMPIFSILKATQREIIVLTEV